MIFGLINSCLSPLLILFTFNSPFYCCVIMMLENSIDGEVRESEEDSHALRGVEKVGLGNDINRGVLTTSTVQRRYNIAKRTAQKYATVTLQGGCLHDHGGRPLTIDMCGMLQIANFVAKDPDCSRSLLRSLIDTEQANTHKRRRRLPEDEEVVLCKISKSSYLRYERKVRELVPCVDFVVSTTCHAGDRGGEGGDGESDGGGGDVGDYYSDGGDNVDVCNVECDEHSNSSDDSCEFFSADEGTS